MNSRLQPVCLAALLGGGFSAFGDDSDSEIKLTGIVCFRGRGYALCELAMPGRSERMRPILQQGERAEGTEIVAIDEKKGTVTVKRNNRQLVLSVGEAGAPDGMPGRMFNLRSAQSDQLLDIYQRIAERTALLAPGLPRVAIDLQSEGPLSAEAALTALADAFAGKSIALVPQGAKFVFAVPASQVARLRELKPPKESDPNSLEKTIPAGMIMFSDSDPAQVLDIYQELSGRTVISAVDRPRLKISIKSQTAWTRSETLWALETVLRLGDVTVSPHQDKIAIAQSPLAALPPKEFPSNQTAAAAARASNVSAAQLVIRSARPEEFLKIYAGLLAREALPIESSLPQTWLRIRSQTPLTAAQSVYALDVLAAVNGFQFVLVGDTQVKLVSVPAGPPNERQ